MANKIPIAWEADKSLGERIPRIISKHFNKKTKDRIEKRKEPEDLSVRGPILKLPIQKEKEGLTARSLIELGGWRAFRVDKISPATKPRPIKKP
jgi:hypothetical protein